MFRVRGEIDRRDLDLLFHHFGGEAEGKKNTKDDERESTETSGWVNSNGISVLQTTHSNGCARLIRRGNQSGKSNTAK